MKPDGGVALYFPAGFGFEAVGNRVFQGVAPIKVFALLFGLFGGFGQVDVGGGFEFGHA